MKNKFSMNKFNYDMAEIAIEENYQIFMTTTIKLLQKRKLYIGELESLSGRGSYEKKRAKVQAAKKNAMKLSQIYLQCDTILTKLELLDYIVKKNKHHPPNQRKKGFRKNKLEKVSQQQVEKAEDIGQNPNAIKIDWLQQEKQIQISDLVSWQQNSPLMNSDYLVINSDQGFLPPESDPAPKTEQQMMEQPKWVYNFFD